MSSQSFAYIRVSTVKQGTQGSSLQEQRIAIDEYAKRHGIEILSWFEERESAAASGRPEFRRMLKLLQHGPTRSVVIHKIDRSARNLRDWADLGDLIDAGVEVHFAHETLDLSTRGGRLAADIQAVVAADFIRNLRDEVKKGMRGRLRQGLYPMRAPIGYLDMGRGNRKELDDEREAEVAARARSLDAAIESVAAQLKELTGLRLRSLLDDTEFMERRALLTTEQLRLTESRQQVDSSANTWFEPVSSAILFRNQSFEWFKHGDRETKRLILETIGSNFTVMAKKLNIDARKPFLRSVGGRAIPKVLEFVENIRTDLADDPDLSALIQRNVRVLRELAAQNQRKAA